MSAQSGDLCLSVDEYLEFEALSPERHEYVAGRALDVDRREKLTAYRHIPSLSEYIIVYQDTVQIELYRKDSDGRWHCQVFTDLETLQLKAVTGTIIDVSIQSVYSGSGVAT